MPTIEPDSYCAILHYANLGERRGAHFQDVLPEHARLLCLWLWNCGPRAIDLPLRPLSPTTAAPILRIICDGPCTSRHSIAGHAVLALSQLFDFLELPLRNSRHLGRLLRRSPVLSQLDESMAHVMAHRRRGSRHASAGECNEDYDTHSGPMEAWSVCVYPDARCLCFRKPSVHSGLTLQ